MAIDSVKNIILIGIENNYDSYSFRFWHPDCHLK